MSEGNRHDNNPDERHVTNESLGHPVLAIVNALVERIAFARQTPPAGKHGEDRRRGNADRRRGTTDRRQGVAERRRTVVPRKDDPHARKLNEKTSFAGVGQPEALLREVNEKLVIATINAQTAAEAADQAVQRMTRMAQHDFLTGLPNRALLADRLERSIALAGRHGTKVALMFLDVDNFKEINDAFGHSIGDQLLQSIAKRLQMCVRFSDTVSRQGGDEFVVLLTDVEGAHGVTLAAQKMIVAVAEPHLVEDQSLHVTLSIGISIYPDDAKDIDNVLRNADAAMYYAKESGRNNYQMFRPDMKSVR
ncbi:GGDEF domain-containing protein [Desulfonatronum thioautotrophicum]|uniref:GGDEF domain-containing protein n=1 Tax=Desulfonatronum thioautotrophicum TaxID=617001 RepID=UPI00069A047A|nr:GGDEF domain-containing protein [Desulfonatronum thioautotrophicum]